MPKALCIFGMTVAGLLLLLFGLDLAIGAPFNGANKMLTDIPMIIAAVGLGFISFTTFREQV